MMKRFVLPLLFAPAIAVADPSQVSFATSFGVPGRVMVASAKEAQPSNGDMRYWVAMDSTLSSSKVVRIERIVFADGPTCEQADCFSNWLEGNRLNPGERLLVMSGKEIAALELFVSDGTQFQPFATLQGPFAECVEDAEARDQYAEGTWSWGRWIAPRVAQAPFPATAADLLVSCVQ
jgi:hypothetical protein